MVMLISALALTACGGGGSSSSGSGEETAVEETIEQSATSTEPSKCTELQTQRFDEQDAATKGSGAVKACEEEVEEAASTAKSVSVSNVEVEGETATAEAAVTGSAFNGQTVEVELAKEGGKWKLDHFVGFAKYDPEALSKALVEELETSGNVEASLISCLGKSFSEASQEEAEELIFSGSKKPLEELAEGCQ